MAEKVQYHLELSVPELEDLSKKKIFNKAELTAIVKKRTQFEQSLARRQVKLADYLKYIQFEMNVEELRKKRHRRLQIKGKATVSDYAGPRRIMYLFFCATNRFFGDIALWVDYIRYAQRIQAYHHAGKLCALALQKHPNNIMLWMLACDHEFSLNANMESARVLMQRGLRLNNDSPDLWAAYFRVELAYLAKLYAREQLLLAPVASDENKEKDNAEEGEDNDADHIKLPSVSVEEYRNDSKNDMPSVADELPATTTDSERHAAFVNVFLTIIKSARTSLSLVGWAQFLISITDVLIESQLLPVARELLEKHAAPMISETLGTCVAEKQPFRKFGELMHRYVLYPLYSKIDTVYPFESKTKFLSPEHVDMKKLVLSRLSSPSIADALSECLNRYTECAQNAMVASIVRAEYIRLFIHTLAALASLGINSTLQLVFDTIQQDAFQQLTRIAGVTMDDHLQTLHRQLQARLHPETIAQSSASQGSISVN
ncbi:U3 snoRNP-associated protein Utp6 [Schizosaccharomyces japonicus yFS275]|uniref:U3 snoRNP-associated protein Utp6 n=1 Tax=Schizosaccharomyces japonicus (strain yFS275 / FY16936) TaxID=402676 RepID=B6K5U3_SCHJY|nr:U3 snoRNP-associated protein Utp6 [Schizosaccharomyces japonicus yFS275]EEB08897.1 U3 snoRNP-associated protein Utp6 [Schizosaccharomyces japonicus yFS275]